MPSVTESGARTSDRHDHVDRAPREGLRNWGNARGTATRGRLMAAGQIGRSDGGGTSASDTSTVLVGDEANQVSVQVLQNIYNEITGKSETVGKTYKDPFEIVFSDIEQLNIRILQAHEQYNVSTSNCNIMVYYLNNTRDQFSSFERFSMHNAGSNSPVESILLKFNFLVILPKVPKPQTYSISIRLISRICLESRFRAENGHFPAFYRLMGGNTAQVEIEYVDYMVARNFLGIIDDWFTVLPRARPRKMMEFLQAVSHWIPRLARFFTTVVVTLVVVQIYPNFVNEAHAELVMFGKFVLFAGLGIYSAHTLASWCGSYAEHAIDRWSHIS